MLFVSLFVPETVTILIRPSAMDHIDILIFMRKTFKRNPLLLAIPKIA